MKVSNYSVKTYMSTVLFIALLFALIGCEQPSPNDQPSPAKDDIKDAPVEKPTQPAELPSPPVPSKKVSVLPSETKPTLETIPAPSVEKSIDNQPDIPSFSSELLAAVQNWKRIPKTSFPVPSVIINQPVTLVAKTSNGVVISSSVLEQGSEVQALAAKGGLLTIAHPNTTKLLGAIDMDQTDFKQCVAYRYELGVRIIKERAQARLHAKQKVSENDDSSSVVDDADNSKVEVAAIPDPLDFGHGRFCICKSCREQRLAHTGTLKTGFGF